MRIDDPQSHSSIIYDGGTQIATATAVPLDPSVTTPLSSFNVDLMDAGVLKVVVTSDGVTYLSLPGGVDLGSPWIYENVRVNGGNLGGNCLNVNIVQGYTTTLTVNLSAQDGTTAAGCSVGTPQ